MVYVPRDIIGEILKVNRKQVFKEKCEKLEKILNLKPMSPCYVGFPDCNSWFHTLPKYKHWEYYGGQETVYNYDFCFSYAIKPSGDYGTILPLDYQRRFYWAPCSLGVAEFKY